LAHYRVLASAWWLLVLLPAAMWLARAQTASALVLLAAAFFGVGWWRASVIGRQLAPYRQLMHQPVTVVGVATDDAAYGARSQLVFGLQHIRVVLPRPVSLPGEIRVGGFGAPAVQRGDMVQVTGKFFPAGGAEASISFGQLRVVRHDHAWINELRRRFAAGLESALPEPQASFGMGLLVGQRSTLPPNTAKVLLMAGLSHIIAVSGYNLTIIVKAVRRLFAARSKFQTAALCSGCIVVFVLLAGASPSIVRASIISMLSLSAWYYGRSIAPLPLLLVAGALSVAANPSYIWGNVSWYLSFLAFFGVVLLAPLLTTYLYGQREPRLVMQVVIESLCAEAMTMPYVLYIFGQVSLVSLPANVLVVALVPLGMLLSLFAGLAGLAAPTLAGWVAWPAALLLSYMLRVSALLAGLPYAFMQNIHFSLGRLVGSYLFVAGAGALLTWRQRRSRQSVGQRHPP